MNKPLSCVTYEDRLARELAGEIISRNMEVMTKVGEFTEKDVKRIFGRSKHWLIPRALKILEDDGKIGIAHTTVTYRFHSSYIPD